MFQGNGYKDAALNADLGPVQPAELNAAIISHAHLDHVGRLPLLTKRGMRCPVYATPATVDFARVLIEDSLKIMEGETFRENKYRARENRPPVEPLYSREDAAALVPLVREIAYNQWKQILPGISVRFTDAGHILGSASVELEVREEGTVRRVTFSADIGRWNTPFLADPQLPTGTPDVVFLESTYGDHDHRPQEMTEKAFEEVLREAIWTKQKVLIPAFAIGRTQQILFHLASLVRAGNIPEFPIYLDSPMAIKATELYKRHDELFDEEAKGLVRRRALDKDLRNLYYVESSDESRGLNDREGAGVIIAGGGMCEGGRIVHHLRHNVWKHGVHVVMVGFASRGTLGRALIDGASEVMIHRRKIPVRAKVTTLGGFSAHAGQSELLRWIDPIIRHKPQVYLTHGEDMQRECLAVKIRERYEVEAHTPALFEIIEV